MSRRPRRSPEPRRLRLTAPAAGPAALGALGEELAAAWLAELGYRVAARGLRTRYGQIDLLARRRRCWVAVEVKTRRDPAPERAISPEQVARIRRVTRALAGVLAPPPRRLDHALVAVHVSPAGAELRWFWLDL